MQSSIQAWDDFYRRYSWENILELAHGYPNQRSLYLDYNDIETFDLELSSELVEHPDLILKHATEALRMLDLPADVDKWQPFVRITGLPEKIRRRDLRDEHIDHLICVEGMALRVTDVSPVIVNAAFKCQRCGEVTFMPQSDEGKFVEPFECENDMCGRKGAFKLIKDQSEFLNGQKIRLSELPEDLNGGEKCQTIDCTLQNDLVGLINPGQRISVVGILRAFQKSTKEGKSVFFDFVLEVNSLKVQDSGQTVVVSSEDRNRLFELAKSPEIVHRLVQSFAPSIHGMQIIKEGLLVSTVSNGYSVRKDGTVQREFSHCLICTDPGMAKSALKHALKSIKPDLVLSSGTGSTKAGLTAAAVKDDFAGGKWSIEAGALPLADGSGLIIDEFDKFDKDYVTSLNDALSNCQFEKDAAGMRMKLWTRCNVIVLMNPKHGRFDTYEDDMIKQLNLPPDTLSRFDLVFMSADRVDEEQDGLVADRVLDAWSGAETKTEEIISLSDMQKYIVLARAIKPTFEPEVLEQIKKRFLITRKKSSGGRIAITNRYVEGLLRIAKAEAQLCLSSKVTIAHYMQAVALLEASLMQIGTDASGQLDTDIINSGQSNSQRNKMTSLLKIIKECESDGIASLSDVIEESKKLKLSDDEMKKYVDELKTNGDIFEPRRGYLKVSA